MFGRAARAIRRLTRADGGGGSDLDVRFVRRADGWLAANLLPGRFEPPVPDDGAAIEARARSTQALGPQPLWDGYADQTRHERSSDEVRTAAATGRFFAWLAATRRPPIVVEFGTAFGVSGMYWLAGLKAAGGGKLLTFEANKAWAAIAETNLASVHRAFHLTVGLFEQEIEGQLSPGEQIDLAFIDAIHTRDFVDRQFAIVRQHARPGALVVFDDIDFSADMAECWAAIAQRQDLVASATIGSRVGIVELP